MAFEASYDVRARLEFDPVQLPRRYREHDDVEVAGLIAASLAYGRAEMFKPVAARILDRMGSRPGQFAREYACDPDAGFFDGISYRFNKPADIAALVAAIGWMSREHGTLGRRFGTLFRNGDLRLALTSFADELRSAEPARRLLYRRGSRGLRHLLPDASHAGACKRWHLYLRWMVRGPDLVDLGVWKDFVPRSALLIPLDTHIARIARYLGLTGRSDLSWRTAEEVTASLREVDPIDPVRFDHALCHHGMSGNCPARRDEKKCRRCALSSVCGRAAAALRPQTSRPGPLCQAG